MMTGNGTFFQIKLCLTLSLLAGMLILLHHRF